MLVGGSTSGRDAGTAYFLARHGAHAGGFRFLFLRRFDMSLRPVVEPMLDFIVVVAASWLIRSEPVSALGKAVRCLNPGRRYSKGISFLCHDASFLSSFS